MGTVGILNVGAGDTKLIFDPNSPQDMIRAARIVKDMLRRGYALLIDSGEKGADGRPVYVRAKDFDESKCEYIIADFDPTIAQTEDDHEQATEPPAAARDGATGPKGNAGRAPKLKRVAADSVSAFAVARTAGG